MAEIDPIDFAMSCTYAAKKYICKCYKKRDISQACCIRQLKEKGVCLSGAEPYPQSNSVIQDPNTKQGWLFNFLVSKSRLLFLGKKKRFLLNHKVVFKMNKMLG